MTMPADIFVHCDDLDTIPTPARDNYIREHDLLVKLLPAKAKVLQIGSMDGTRAVRLLKARPDLQLTGLEIEESLVALAQKNLAEAELTATFIHGDITDPPDLSTFNYVCCLNNTLGYIPDEQAAIKYMKQLGEHTVISVYGERFHDELATKYFASIGITLQSIENNTCILEGYGRVKRYTQRQVETWGGKIIETPLGYFCIT